jgi:hypothetical protein
MSSFCLRTLQIDPDDPLDTGPKNVGPLARVQLGQSIEEEGRVVLTFVGVNPSLGAGCPCFSRTMDMCDIFAPHAAFRFLRLALTSREIRAEPGEI